MSENHNPERAYYHENDDHLDFSSTHLEQHDRDRDRPSSIDMSLELERQLDAEHEAEQHPDLGTKTSDGSGRRVSLDPVILSSIVAGLRENLAEMTRERDGLVETLGLSHAREAELKEALALVTERCSALENEAEELRKKSQDDDAAIHLLREKVEESRRGLMRLQTESKRMSHMSNVQNLDVGRANSLFSSGPPSSKRMSFTPLTGSGAARVNPHRRTSSVSEPGFAFLDVSNDSLGTQGSPPSRVTSLPEEGDVKASRRTSGFFARAKSSPSPPQLPRQLSPEPPHFDSAATQLELFKRERDAAKAELAHLKLELSEAQEACEASNQCVRALRIFISDHGVGEGSGASGSAAGLKLPPLPTDKDAEREEPAEPRKSLSGGSGWSIGKLWRADTTERRDSTSSNPATGPTSPVSERSSSTAAAPSITVASPGVQNGGISRKFTGFFSSRASAPSAQPQQPGAPTKDVPTPHGFEEPMFNGLGSDGEADGDNSSIDDSLEPRSPEHESIQAAVLVRDASSSSVGSSSVIDADASDTKTPIVQQAERHEPTAL